MICLHHPTERRKQFKTVAKIRARIHRILKKTIRDSPLELIDTSTGELHGRDKRESMFKSSPIYEDLISSMTTCFSRFRIKRVIREYFQYVVLSHKWDDNEPLFQEVVKIAVYRLGDSPTYNKLQTYCKVSRDAGFHWAWSDTCCIDKSDKFVLQESLVAMFGWYQGSALMIVFLRGVGSSSPPGALAGSIWNTRAWTLQEYIAAKNIRFYTEDWTLYRDLPLSNHKEPPEVISEMEQATKVSAQQLRSLRPGLSNIREKLRLASNRDTTRVEDAAYSLLGIFSAAGISAIYGEGEVSLARLLSNILTRSGDVSILAWTGESSQFNSCLPAHITVFSSPATSHLPAPISDADMQRIIADTQFDRDMALQLYDRLDGLSAPKFSESRMTLPCIASYLLPSSSHWQQHRTRLGRTYHMDTVMFGRVEIRTRQDLSQMTSLYLVHPWLDTLLQGEDTDHLDAPSPPPDTEDEDFSDDDSDEEFDKEFSNEDTHSSSPVNMLRPTLHNSSKRAPMVREIDAQ